MQTFNPDQKSLTESNELYRSMIENSRDGICITQNSHFTYVNKSFCELLGYTLEELTGLLAADLLLDGDKERVIDQHNQRMAGNPLQGINYVALVHKNGKLVDIEYTASSILYYGTAASFISVRDITERKRMQQKLEQSEQKYRNLVENANDGIIITQFGKFKYVNQAFCNMVEYSAEELIERNFMDVVADEEKQRLQEFHRLRMSGGKHHMIYEARGISKSGRSIYFEINTSYIEYNGYPATFIILRDHTAQKALEETLKASENKYRKLFEAESDAIFMIEKESGQILDANPAATQIYGYSHDEFLALKNVDISAEPEKTQEATVNDLSFIPIRYHKRKDQTVFAVEISAGVTELDHSKVHIITAREITSRIKMQNALEKSERKFRELADLLPQSVYELDAHGNGTYLNKAGQIAMGFTGEDIRFHALDGVIPEDHFRMKENMHKTFQEKRLSFSDEYTALRKDGSTFPAIFYAAAMIENGEFMGTRGLIIDISERKAMEESLRKSEEHYRRVIQSLQEGLFVLQDEKFFFVNDSIGNILGYTVEEMTGKHFSSVIPSELVEEGIKKYMERQMGTYGSWSYEFTLLHKDGHTRVPVILSTVLTEFDGKHAIVGTAKDITDRINAEEEIKAAHKKLEHINIDLEKTIGERTKELTKANTQLLKLQKENLQSQFDVLKQQVNPHFLFNSLNVLTSLIRLEPELAEKFTEHLAKVYRYVLENKDNELVSLSTEISFLNAYIFLINIRFMDKVMVNIRIPDHKMNLQIIPLAMQLLIENAIKHNAMSKKSPLVIDIYIDDHNQLKVVNNLQEREAHMTSTGIGLKNIQNRYRLLNNTIPVFEKTNTQFIASIPLIGEQE